MNKSIKYYINEFETLYVKINNLNNKKLQKNEILLLDSLTRKFIMIINNIRQLDIEKALMLNLPILNKSQLQFTKNYCNYYQYLYLYLENEKELMNIIVKVVNLLENVYHYIVI